MSFPSLFSSLFPNFPSAPAKRLDRRHYYKHRADAHALIAARTEEIAAHYRAAGHDLHYLRITVRNQKTRWGSCSRRGALSFNFRLAFLPPELRDYVIVHELCHLAEFNHGRAFWALVGLAVPDYREVRGRLRRVRM